MKKIIILELKIMVCRKSGDCLKKYINNNEGDMTIWFFIVIIVFLGMLVTLDFLNIYGQSKDIKSIVNRSVKAAAMQIKDGEELAEGRFLIDENKAEIVFYDILSTNLGLNKDTLEPLEKSLLFKKPVIKELEVINTTPTNYTSPTIEKNYEIVNPSVVAVVEFEIKGIVLSDIITVDKLSSSQLTSIYD